jgi:hypothetical protein
MEEKILEAKQKVLDRDRALLLSNELFGFTAELFGDRRQWSGYLNLGTDERKPRPGDRQASFDDRGKECGNRRANYWTRRTSIA